MFYYSTKSGVDRGFLFFSIFFILSSLLNLNLTLFQDRLIADAFLLLIISALLIIYFLKSHKQSSFKLSELGFLLFVVYVTFKNILANTFDVSSVSYLAFFVTLYYGLKIFFTVNNLSTNPFALLFSTGIILLAYLAFAVYHCYFQKETLTNFFFPNKSIFSILLASQIVFMLPIWLFYKKGKGVLKNTDWLYVGLIATALFLLAFTQDRAGYIGLVLALSYIAYQYFSTSNFKKITLYLVFPVFVLLTVAMFLYKSDSSNGRLLIYKISANMLKDNWLFGIGQGQFKVHYNQYQAAYFASHSIDSKEALLADNTFYAFNDFLQGLIENGLLSFLLLTATLFLLVIQIKKAETTPDNKHLFTASIASLICIFSGALFSYPLQIFPIAAQATLCLCIINSFPTEKKIQIELSKTGSKITKITLLLLSTLLFIQFSFYFSYKRESNQAFELKKSGFKQRAIEKYRDLNSSYIQEGNTFYLYAQELYYSNRLTQAQKILIKAKRFYCTNEVYKLSAAIESELQNYLQAEADYKKAIYMVPNRMISRNALFDYYLERKDTVNAIYWANSILKMPVKITSLNTGNIQKKAQETLLKLSK